MFLLILGKHPGSVTMGSAVFHEEVMKPTHGGTTSRSIVNRDYARGNINFYAYNSGPVIIVDKRLIIMLEISGAMQLLLRAMW